jgi:hypothetical protein
MVIPTSQRIEFIDIGDIVRDIERKFPVDPVYRDWKGKREINIRCPKCTDKKYHLGLNFAKNAFNCFRCPFQGRLTDFLRFNGIKFRTKGQVYSPEATSLIAPKIKIPIDFDRNENVARKAKEYMAIQRGFDLKFLKNNFEIWPITNGNHYYFGYIIIKLNDYAFYARQFIEIEGKQPHIIRKTDKQMKLFYAYEKNNSSTVLVVESMFNLMKAAQFGFDAVCLFGKGNWASLVEYLKVYDKSRNLCLCFDRDVIMKDVSKFVRRIARLQVLTNMFYVDPVDMPCEDIAEMEYKETLIKTINKKKPINEMFINMMSIGD